MKKPRMSDSRIRLLIYIRQYRIEKKYSPSMRDMLIDLGYSSTSVVGNDLKALKALGLINFVPGLGRTAYLTSEGHKYLSITPAVG